MSAQGTDFGQIDEGQLVALAQRLAGVIGHDVARSGGMIHLRGELGAGKTTFARALLHALGVGDRVTSPTYSLVESYRVGELDIHHLDLYRIADPGELEWLGLDALAGPRSLLLVEWPERGAKSLPAADIVIGLCHAGPTRTLAAEPRSARAAEWVREWHASAGEN